MAKYEVFATHFDNAAKEQREYIAGSFDSYNNARIFADAYSAHYSSPARVREISEPTATAAELAAATRRADDAATETAELAERAAGLLDALEVLTDRNGRTADAVLYALRCALCEMQNKADRTAEDTVAARSLCAQVQQTGRGYTLDSGEALADFARRVQKLTPEQLDQLDR